MITGVIGPNGAGKSTALRALYGLLKPVAGDVLIDGKMVTGLPPWRFIDHGIALVPQHRSLFNELSVEDNLRLACWSFRRDRAPGRGGAGARLRPVSDAARQAPRDVAGSMSGGQQRFLELGRALALQPRVAAARRADGDDRADAQRRDLRVHPRSAGPGDHRAAGRPERAPVRAHLRSSSTCSNSAATRSTARPRDFAAGHATCAT